MYNYAQLNEENICICVSSLSTIVPEYNYELNEDYNPITEETTTEEVFVSRMIPIPHYSENYLGLRYNELNKWEVVPEVEETNE